MAETIGPVVDSLPSPVYNYHMHSKESYVGNIEEATLENTNFRKVLFTSGHMQLVVMDLLPNEDIGMESHTLDQFIRVEKGNGIAILNGIEHVLSDGVALVITAGTEHNIINTSSIDSLKLYTIYAPPNHKDGTVHRMKADAMLDEHDEY